MTEELEPGFGVDPEQPRRHARSRMVASIAAVVALAAGGVASYVAFAASGGGANSPTQAVQRVIGDLEHADLLGAVDDLVPSERTALSGAVTADVAALKRLGALSGAADPSAVSGVHFATHGLEYGATLKVNDHVQIVQLTAGTIDMSADAAKLPFTQRLLDLTHGTKNAQRHLTITRAVRIAAQQEGGRWYASVFYTIADQAAHHRIPSAADHVAATGAGSPQDAVQSMVRALLGGDARAALAMISPTELGALHDYGGLLPATTHRSSLPVSLTKLELATTPIKNGVRVTVTKLVVGLMGQQVTVGFAGGCLNIDSALLTKRLCGGDAASQLGALMGGALCASGFHRGAMSKPGVTLSGSSQPTGCFAPRFTQAQRTAIGDLLTALPKLGVDTAREGGAWYVTPVRSLADATVTLLSALHGDDLFQLASLKP